MEPSEGKKRAYIDDAALLDLFEQLEGATEASRISFRYLLTLMLMRRRLLKHEGTKRGAGGEPLRLDVLDAAAVAALPARLQGRVIDVAIVNAGVYGPRVNALTAPGGSGVQGIT